MSRRAPGGKRGAAPKPASAPRPGPDALRDVPLGLVLLCALFLGAPALTAPFFADDYLFLDSVRRHPLPAGLFAPDPIGNFVRPVSRALYYGVLAPLTGESNVLFHAANLILIAAVLVLFFVFARRLVGGRGAIAGTAFLALHYAFDVPARWVSGSQDLLAIASALLALLLAGSGRALAAGAVLFAGLLSKEVVVGTAPIALALSWARGGDRRAAVRETWPLFAATALWAAIWLWVRAADARPDQALGVTPGDALAAFAHGAQVAFGLELREPRLRIAGRDLLAVGAAVAAVLLAFRGARRERARGDSPPRDRTSPGRVAIAGALWAALGIAPIVPVAAIWSAYFYLFALAGVALALAAWARARRALVVATAVAVLGLVSAQSRGLDSFASTPGAWTAQSHVDRHYLDRAMKILATLLRELKGLRPRAEPRTTFWFANLPTFVALHSADGPVVRWAYRDSSLRSDFVSHFMIDDAHPRPWVLINFDHGHLTEMNQPGILFLIGSNLAELGSYHGAESVFRASIKHEPALAPVARAWLGPLAWAQGDTARAIELVRASLRPGSEVSRRTFAPSELAATRAAAEALLARGDTLDAYELAQDRIERAPLDAATHALAADLALPSSRLIAAAMLESFTARVLDPTDASAWRRWAIIVARRNRGPETARAIERYRALGGAAAAADSQMIRIEARARELMPGGAQFEQSLR